MYVTVPYTPLLTTLELVIETQNCCFKFSGPQINYSGTSDKGPSEKGTTSL